MLVQMLPGVPVCPGSRSPRTVRPGRQQAALGSLPLTEEAGLSSQLLHLAQSVPRLGESEPADGNCCLFSLLFK